ncbi:hypothetical protein [Streptomyces sp. NPDC003943]
MFVLLHPERPRPESVGPVAHVGPREPVDSVGAERAVRQHALPVDPEGPALLVREHPHEPPEQRSP